MSEKQPIRARAYVDGLAAAGRYHFASSEARAALGVSPAAAKLALSRLAKQGLIAQPARGFYVIVPPEYRTIGCLPAEQFIPALMAHLGLPYYAGLLSAAQFYGAAHHRPQEFQVFIPRRRARIPCGGVRVAFLPRMNIESVPTRAFNTPRGTIAVSTPEATALDLVGHFQHAGGFDQVATVLAELVEQLDTKALADAARFAPLSWAQRLGYVLEHIGTGEKTESLRQYIHDRARDYTPLIPSAPVDDAERDTAWKVVVNERIEAEL